MSFKDLIKKTSQTLQKVKKDISNGKPAYISGPGLVETGISLYLEDNILKSSTPKFRNIISQSPEATILLKKKAFSTFASANDIRFMEKTERMLLRATKALFAYKVQQIRSYESLTKFEKFYSQTGTYSMNLLSLMMQQSSFLVKNKNKFSEKFLEKLDFKNEDDYVNVKLSEWLKQPVSNLESKKSLVSSDLIVDRSGFLRRESGYTRTNQEYILTLDSFAAQQVIESKTAELREEYRSEVEYQPFESDSYFSSIFDYTNHSSGVSGFSISEILSLIKKNAFSQDNYLTTWIVDPNSVDNYLTGPGTGVIELASFTDFNCECSVFSNPSQSSFTLEMPYGIGRITDEDVEIAIEEALRGTVGLFADLASNGFLSSPGGITKPISDGISAIGAAAILGSGDAVDSSIDIDYIRKSLRKFYLGKNIVNSSDYVHIFIRGNRFRQSFKESDNDLLIDNSEYSISDTVFKAEYELYTSKQIPFEDYKKLRKYQDNSLGMVQVFCGYVESSSESYGGGSTSIRVSAKDNMAWLSWSRVPSEPILTDVSGILEDPLTPYKIKVNDSLSVDFEALDLLDENKSLLSSELLSYSSGLFSGKNANENNLIQGQYSGIGSLNGSRVIQHPDGLVYRWKTGIISATAGFFTVGNRSPAELAQYTQYYAPSATKNPVNNLDVANIISTLVTGEPYNVLRYVEQAFQAGNKNSRDTTLLGRNDPLRGYLDAVKRQNKIYGNFKPYRLFTQNSATLELLSLQGRKQEINNEVKILSNRKAKLNEQILRISSSFGSNNPVVKSLIAEVNSIDAAINLRMKDALSVSNAINSAEQLSSTTFGSLFNPLNSQPLLLADTKDEHEEIVRAMSQVGAMRRIEDVRLNRDNNYLIVSDQYDTSDIRPFILGMNNSQFKKFDGEYEGIYDLCVSASRYVHMEFFCNTQGHLELRPPQWNKTPLTLLKDLVRYKRITGKDVIPDFITSSLKTREKNLYEYIYYLNIRIVLLALLLGRFPDKGLIPGFLGPQDEASLLFFGVKINNGESESTRLRNSSSYSNNLDSISKQTFDSQKLNRGIYISFTFQDDPMFIFADTETIIGEFDAIAAESINLIENTQNIAYGYGSPIAKSLATPENLNILKDSFKKLTGRDPAVGLYSGDSFKEKDFAFFKDEKIDGNGEDEGAIFSSTKITKIIRELNLAVSERDNNVRLLRSSLERKRELEEAIGILNNEDNSLGVEQQGPQEFSTLDRAKEFLDRASDVIQTASDIITGDTYRSTAFDYLIENDEVNIIGYGSGKRFIIHDDQIISSNFSENPPSFTRCDIIGDTPLDLTGGIASAVDSKLLWAGATDFDLWRQYGYKVETKNIPFITDAETMGKPYAILELIVAGADINSGSVNIIGNEFYQPGDMVYIASKNMLYYVTNVSHNFNYSSGDFTTNLTLKYGRAPGIYLPSPMDIFGQQELGKESPQFLTYRTARSDDNYIPLAPESTLVVPRSIVKNTSSNAVIDLLSFQNNNLRFTQMMSQLSTGAIAGDKYLLIRAFAKDEYDDNGIDIAKRSLDVIRSIFQNPIQVINAPTDAINLDGIRYSAQTMSLPNSRIAPSIPGDKIIEQISYLKKPNDEENSTGIIKCLNQELSGIINSSLDLGVNGTSSSLHNIFPKDGPRQRSWVDIRDNIMELFESFAIVEIGIINMSSKLRGGNV